MNNCNYVLWLYIVKILNMIMLINDVNIIMYVRGWLVVWYINWYNLKVFDFKNFFWFIFIIFLIYGFGLVLEIVILFRLM